MEPKVCDWSVAKAVSKFSSSMTPAARQHRERLLAWLGGICKVGRGQQEMDCDHTGQCPEGQAAQGLREEGCKCRWKEGALVRKPRQPFFSKGLTAPSFFLSSGHTNLNYLVGTMPSSTELSGRLPWPMPRSTEQNPLLFPSSTTQT